ncbi:hypothetical protein AMST5_04263 [freshwater sediment metagenome]|uniref:Uncharacterized protein n=1 Tax=freshwater sediment metagenome TaxID=556182 RepID=A0AA48M3E8_9ZZZZ
MTEPTSDDVAKWMLSKFEEKGILYQEECAWDIQEKFGRDFLYDNANGNPAISKKVLDIFTKLSGEGVVWSRGERCWRRRIASDKPGRMQD